MAKEHRDGRGTDNDRWQRRQALQLAAQLPDGRKDQLAIIRHLQWLVENYLADARRKGKKA